jgi:hypothetical protein
MEEYRRHQRFRLQPNFGFLRDETGRESVYMLRDISRTGACAERMPVSTGGLPPVGSAVRFGDFPEDLAAMLETRDAEVVWQNDNRMGMRFNRPIEL